MLVSFKTTYLNQVKILFFAHPNMKTLIVIGDFNAEMTNTYLEEFCESYNLTALPSQT